MRQIKLTPLPGGVDLTTLMNTVEDIALTWQWRSDCLEHLSLPLARPTFPLPTVDELSMPVKAMPSVGSYEK